MADLAIHPALSGRQTMRGRGICVEPLPESSVIQVVARPPTDLRAALQSLMDPSASVRGAAPGSWFVVAATADPALAERLGKGLNGHATVIDQSHGQVRIRVAGQQVENVLAKGCGVDLASAAFPVGRSATALVGHITAQLTRTEESEFELMVMRSFANGLWDDLERMCAEFVE